MLLMESHCVKIPNIDYLRVNVTRAWERNWEFGEEDKDL